MDRSSSQPPETSGASVRPELTKEQQSAVFRAASRRVTAATRREPADSTRSLLGDAADTSVYGAFVSLKRGGRLRSCCGHIQSSVPLHEALDSAADRAATDDPRFPPISPAELSQLDMDVWILWGPQPVAARGEDRAGAVVIGKHGVQIARGHARGLLLPGVAVDHGFDARTFLEQVCIKAGLPTDAWKEDDTELRIFEGEAIHGRLEVEMEDARQPAVAGGFYPGEPREVQRALDKLFAADSPPPKPQRWAGAMAPHAGWVY
jgi:AmmeMemoRadiSam system protein A